jgi:hypothetical protein
VYRQRPRGRTLAKNASPGLDAEDNLSFPTHDNLIDDLRKVYVGWQPWDRTYLSLGRINLKSEVALGYNRCQGVAVRSALMR